jgi:hypothetical protein
MDGRPSQHCDDRTRPIGRLVRLTPYRYLGIVVAEGVGKFVSAGDGEFATGASEVILHCADGEL